MDREIGKRGLKVHLYFFDGASTKMRHGLITHSEKLYIVLENNEIIPLIRIIRIKKEAVVDNFNSKQSFIGAKCTLWYLNHDERKKVAYIEGIITELTENIISIDHKFSFPFNNIVRVKINE